MPQVQQCCKGNVLKCLLVRFWLKLDSHLNLGRFNIWVPTCNVIAKVKTSQRLTSSSGLILARAPISE